MCNKDNNQENSTSSTTTITDTFDNINQVSQSTISQTELQSDTYSESSGDRDISNNTIVDETNIPTDEISIPKVGRPIGRTNLQFDNIKAVSDAVKNETQLLMPPNINFEPI